MTQKIAKMSRGLRWDEFLAHVLNIVISHTGDVVADNTDQLLVCDFFLVAGRQCLGMGDEIIERFGHKFLGFKFLRLQRLALVQRFV